MVYFGYVKESVELFNWIRLLRAPSGLALDVSRDGASPTSLGNLVQCLTTPSVKHFFLLSSLNLPSSLVLAQTRSSSSGVWLLREEERCLQITGARGSCGQLWLAALLLAGWSEAGSAQSSADHTLFVQAVLVGIVTALSLSGF